MDGANHINYNNVQVPVFEGENYDFWSIKMQTLFRLLDAWEIVESGYEEPETTTNLYQAQQKEIKEKRRTDAGALSMIQRGVSNSIFPRIMRATRSKEAWDTLQLEFQGDNKDRLKKEQEEKEKAEAHLYTIIKVARDGDLAEQIGKDIYFDLVDHDKVRSFRIQKQMTFNVFQEEVAREFGIPVRFQRFWLWAERNNHTYRLDRPLTPLEETQSVGTLREVSNKVYNAELKLFLEVELGLNSRPIAPPDKTKGDILLFFKHYDPEKEELRFIGRLFVRSSGKPIEIVSKLNKMAGFAPDEEINLYEEIKFEPSVMCEPIDKKITFRASQLQDGDILCLQKSFFRYPDVPSFLEYVRNR